MAEELEGGAVAAVGVPTGGDGSGPIAEGPTTDDRGRSDDGRRTTDGRPVDLTQLPEFRRWQANADRRDAAYKQELAEARRQAEETARKARELEERMQESQLADADPAEVIRFYRERETRMRDEMSRQAQAEARKQAINERAGQFLESVGLKPDTPGLDWTGGPTEEGLVALMESAGQVLSLRAGELARSRTTTAEEAAREARQETLVESGAARVSTSAGGAPSSLRAEYEARKKTIRRGDVSGHSALRREFRLKGLDV